MVVVHVYHVKHICLYFYRKDTRAIVYKNFAEKLVFKINKR